MISIARPSRRVRESGTAMRYCGLRILPNRVSLIFTAMVKRLLLRVSRCNSAIRAGCQDPVLPRVCDRRTSTPLKVGRAADSRPLCQNQALRQKFAEAGLLQNFLEALGFHPAGHPPTFRGADELIVVPQPAEHHLLFVATEHHRVEADRPRRRGIPVDA